MKNLVIVTPARSGSVWLTNALHRTQNYKPYREYFEGDNYYSNLGTVEERIELLNKDRPWVTKILTDDMVDLELFKEHGCLFIWLSRTNIVEHFLSMTLAVKTRVFSADNNFNSTYQTPDRLDIIESDLDFYENIHKCKLAVYEQYKDWWHFELEYETMMNDNPWRMPADAGGTRKLNTYPEEWIVEATEKLKERNIL